MSDRTFYLFFGAFFVGVFAFSFLRFADFFYVILAALVLVATFLVLFGKRPYVCFIVFGTIISFAIGGIRIEFSKPAGHPLDQMLGQKVTLDGSVCDDPVEQNSAVRFCFAPMGSLDRILVTAVSKDPIEYGDRLKILGKFVLPKNFEAYPGGPEFDYVSYLGKDDIRYTMFRPFVTPLGINDGGHLVRALFHAKRLLTNKIRQVIPEPEASLLGGLLLGDRQSLPKETVNEFKNAGLVHILVLSGYNVTIVADSLMRLFSFLPRLVGTSLGALSIVLFAIMTGGAATTIRASVMALIAILARSSARRYHVSRALIIAAAIMVMQNPRILVFDVSFELSCLATIALVYISPFVLERLQFVPETWKLRDTLATTISTQIFVLPFILYTMGQLSIISFISNIFVLPIVPYAMLGGFTAILTGFVHMFLAFPFALVTTFMLSYILRAVSFFGNLPFAAVHVSIGLLVLVIIYILYGFILYKLHAHKQKSLRKGGTVSSTLLP